MLKEMGYIIKLIKCKTFHLQSKPTANGKKKP